MRKSDIIFRNYESFGYITDNRNFSYKKLGDTGLFRGDKILSESGVVFYSALGNEPKSIDELSIDIRSHYLDVPIETIKEDAAEFYNMLELEGFLASGETYQVCKENDTLNIEGKIFFAQSRNRPCMNLADPSISSQDFLEKHYNYQPQLTNLHIEITSRCNERCIHCYIPHDTKDSDISPTLFNSILEQCINMKVLHLTLSGGEPLLHKEFSDFLRKCREYNFSVNVLSNLTLLNDEILDEMKLNPLLGVQVSLYSMDPKIHDAITQQNGSHRKTIDGILKLVKNKIPMQISCPIMKQNRTSYHEVVTWAEKNNISVGDDYVIIARSNHTTQNLCNRLSVDEVEDVIREMILNDPRYLPQLEKEADRKKNTLPTDYVCSVCHSSICISTTGDVYPCAGWQDFSVGNLNNFSLQEIWDNSEKIKYLRNLRELDFPKCSSCSDDEYCTKCMVRNANEDPNGNPLVVSEYFCEIAKLIKKIILKKRTKTEVARLDTYDKV